MSAFLDLQPAAHLEDFELAILYNHVNQLLILNLAPDTHTQTHTHPISLSLWSTLTNTGSKRNEVVLWVEATQRSSDPSG